jgi:hypothetical protein
MSSSFIGRHRIRARSIFSATVILAAISLFAKLTTSDALTLGYTMVVPVFVYLSVLFEGARTDKRTLRSLRAWTETSIAVGGAAGVGYLGYRLWLLGF